MSQGQEVAKVAEGGEKMGEKKEEKKEEEEVEPCNRQPGFCSATCMNRACVREAIKQPLKTSDVYATCNLPKRFDHPHWFNGYGSQVNKQHPFYRTTASVYGWYPPGIQSVPSAYFPLTQHFTSALYATGMYRNYSLNMSAPDPPTKMC